jgi:hypothetical protein
MGWPAASDELFSNGFTLTTGAYSCSAKPDCNGMDAQAIAAANVVKSRGCLMEGWILLGTSDAGGV